MKRVLLITLGCKVNQYESAAFHTGFIESGYTVVKSAPAEVVVINTCAVTAKAGAQSRQSVRKALRENGGARVIITGCYAELAADELAGLDELRDRDYSIIGNSKKDQLVDTALSSNPIEHRLLLGTITAPGEICRLPVRHFGDRTRAFLRIQDGCESFCTYCIVPYTRGPSRSLPAAEVLEQALSFAKGGYREIVLTGIHLGNYGRDQKENVDLTTLLDRLSAATPGIRYRISSLEPTEIDERLLTLMRDRANIMPHLHIPLQSGNDEILSRMQRGYTTADFARVVDNCRSYLPDSGIGIDILAGFPGESEDQFAGTLDFLRSLPFTYLHVFPYSRRPGTIAARMTDDVTKGEKDRRVRSLRDLGEQKRIDFYHNQCGRTLPVLVEARRDREGYLQGFTSNYVTVHFQGKNSLKNRIVWVRLTQYDGNRMTGEVQEQDED